MYNYSLDTVVSLQVTSLVVLVSCAFSDLLASRLGSHCCVLGFWPFFDTCQMLHNMLVEVSAYWLR